MVEDRNEKRITVRVAPDLYEQIVQEAKARNLSINAFIIQALEEAVHHLDVSDAIDHLLDRIKAIEENLHDSPRFKRD